MCNGGFFFSFIQQKKRGRELLSYTTCKQFETKFLVGLNLLHDLACISLTGVICAEGLLLP